MRPSSTYSRLLFPVIAGADAVGLSIGLIIPLTSIVLVAAKVENNQIAIPRATWFCGWSISRPVHGGAIFQRIFLETASFALFSVFSSGPVTGKALRPRFPLRF